MMMNTLMTEMQSAHPWRPNRCRADVCGRRQDERGHQLLWWLGQVCDVSLDLHGELLLGSGQKILQWLEKLIINLQIIIFEILHSDNLCWELWMFISIFCDLDLLFKVMRHFGCCENYTLTFNFHWVDSVWLLLDTEFEPVSHRVGKRYMEMGMEKLQKLISCSVVHE